MSRHCSPLRFLLPCLAAVWWAVVALPMAQADSVWNVVKYEGRDYLTMRNVADFYKLQYSQPGGAVGGALVARLLHPGRGRLEGTHHQRGQVHHEQRPRRAGGQHPPLAPGPDQARRAGPAAQPHPGAAPSARWCIDPGHGGYDRGATSIYGCEANFALDTSLRLREMLLRRGYRVEMTRTTDVFIPLEERAAFANKFRDGIFVCIHYNAGSDFGTGIETYTLAPRFVPSTGDDSPTASCLLPCAGNVEDPENMALATASHAALLSRLPMVDRGIKRARFCVLRLCTIPGVLIEGGFVSNVQEAAKIATPAYRQAEAEAIALAIDNYRAATAVPGRRPILAGPAPGEHPVPEHHAGLGPDAERHPVHRREHAARPDGQPGQQHQQGPTVVVPQQRELMSRAGAAGAPRRCTGFADPTVKTTPSNARRLRPIGVFDSGVGGLTVVSALRRLLPNEHIFYLGDNARIPYGNKGAATVERYSFEMTGLLLAEGAKAIVVACNTATALAVPRLQDTLQVPVLGVIAPGAAAAVAATRSGRVGVIGTHATISSGAYERALQQARATTGGPCDGLSAVRAADRGRVARRSR